MQRLPDEIPPLGWHMVVPLPEDHDGLASDLSFCGSFETIVSTLSKASRVDVRGKVANGSSNTLIESSAESQVSAETHSCCANSAIASREFGEQIDGEGGVFVVGRDFLLDLPGVAGIGAGSVIS